MSDSASYWLTRGIAAARERDVEEARFYLERALNSDPDHKQRVDANYWLSEITDDPQQRRNYLEEILVHEPSHYVARRNLAILDGRLEPEQVVNPEQLAEKEVSAEVQARRFICPRCGGRMAFTADGRSLALQLLRQSPEPDAGPGAGRFGPRGGLPAGARHSQRPHPAKGAARLSL